MTTPAQPGALTQQSANGGHQTANLGDILERVLDKGLVIAGDIRVNLLDIELLTIKLRLVIASLETAKQVGIDWWEHDPWLSGRADRDDRSLERENEELRARVAELEGRAPEKIEGGGHA
ncbi:gas vesicle protein GvpJ [Actinophytocola sp. KF-1]